jgi:demethoxyubiquinone hydroxylase (CLK1/Coq7/Cat5 family)
MPERESRRKLIALLQLAYSAERAAAYAYRGHWHSVASEEERARIRQIEDEEWHHRELVGGMLERLGSAPNRQRELRSLLVSEHSDFFVT